MTNCRIALANLSIAETPETSVDLAVEAIAEAGRQGAQIICFPECYIPGYRWRADTLPPPSLPFLESAWERVGAAARSAGISVILGTERPTEHGLQITARVYNPDGSTQGWQDKGQLDPSEEAHYPAFGGERRVFTSGDVTFGIVICHEGWRYPETVRWAARRGAQIVFHPFAHVAEPGSYRPETFAHPDNTFHEKAMLCRAAENNCWFASVNSASDGAPAYFSDCSTRWHVIVLPAIRRGGTAYRRPRPEPRYAPPRRTLPHIAIVIATVSARDGQRHSHRDRVLGKRAHRCR